MKVMAEASAVAGGAWSELYLVSISTGRIRPFITGEVNIGSPAFSPDGSRLAFTMSRGKKAKTQVWMIPVDGGESIPVTKSDTDVRSFRWHPDGAPASEGDYVVGRRSGPWCWWHPDGSLAERGVYRDDRREGPWELFAPGERPRQAPRWDDESAQ